MEFLSAVHRFCRQARVRPLFFLKRAWGNAVAARLRIPEQTEGGRIEGEQGKEQGKKNKSGKDEVAVWGGLLL